MPQGGPLSPLLSNIMLNELDKELARRGHRFVRYADDCMIFCKSKKSAERTLNNIVPYIEEKLFLKVNRTKTCVAHISKVKYLGYSFYKYKGKCRFRVHPKSVEKMKNKIRELTARSNGWANEYRALKLTQFVRGWVNYFGMADMKSLLRSSDEWLRHNLIKDSTVESVVVLLIVLAFVCAAVNIYGIEFAIGKKFSDRKKKKLKSKLEKQKDIDDGNQYKRNSKNMIFTVSITVAFEVISDKL